MLVVHAVRVAGDTALCVGFSVSVGMARSVRRKFRTGKPEGGRRKVKSEKLKC